MTLVKRILAMFTLVVFLFPFVEKEVHQWVHPAPPHCQDHQSVHFHQVEHHCFLCDMTIPLSPVPTPEKVVIISPADGTNTFSFPFLGIDLPEFACQLLRGPPSLA